MGALAEDVGLSAAAQADLGELLDGILDAKLVGADVNGAVRPTTDLFLDDILIYPMMSPPVCLVTEELYPSI